MTSEELGRLGDALRQYQREGGNITAANAIKLLALTGARRGEIETLKWSNVDFERGIMLLEDSKTGRVAWPLSRSALELLTEVKAASSSIWVFPASTGTAHYQGLNRAWPKVREIAHLEGVRLHDLRHSFASVGAASGLGLQVVGKLLGHKQTSTTARYSHIGNDPLRNAADRIGGEIAGLMDADSLKD